MVFILDVFSEKNSNLSFKQFYNFFERKKYLFEIFDSFWNLN